MGPWNIVTSKARRRTQGSSQRVGALVHDENSSSGIRFKKGKESRVIARNSSEVRRGSSSAKLVSQVASGDTSKQVGKEMRNGHLVVKVHNPLAGGINNPKLSPKNPPHRSPILRE